MTPLYYWELLNHLSKIWKSLHEKNILITLVAAVLKRNAESMESLLPILPNLKVTEPYFRSNHKSYIKIHLTHLYLTLTLIWDWILIWTVSRLRSLFISIELSTHFWWLSTFWRFGPLTFIPIWAPNQFFGPSTSCRFGPLTLTQAVHFQSCRPSTFFPEHRPYSLKILTLGSLTMWCEDPPLLVFWTVQLNPHGTSTLTRVNLDKSWWIDQNDENK